MRTEVQRGAGFDNQATRETAQSRFWNVPYGLDMSVSLRLHWPEYLMEFAEISLYMFCLCLFATLFQNPISPVRHFVAIGFLRRALMGLAVGATVVAIVMSPWGRQSGGHMNPAMTFAFYRLGKVAPWDALFYGIAQFSGATGGVALAAALLRRSAGNGAVRYAVTAPGEYGPLVAFLAELVISFLLMMTVLVLTHRPSLAPHTAYFVGLLYLLNTTFEAPLSGMSMNPARTFGPAAYAGYWHALWIYLFAPTIGMLGAAGFFLRVRQGRGPYCAKLYHDDKKRCIFRHEYQQVK